MSHRFRVLVAKNREGIVEISDDTKRAALKFESVQREANPTDIGSAYWEAMKASGVDPLRQNHFHIHEGDRDGILIAALYPVLDGARVVWLVLYRADHAASCFRPLGNRQRIGDALDLAFHAVIDEIQLPHKP
ncbi:MAG: hypothetical protein HC923_00075 [Myxococcales bacterium]|nr:hypothetical protein [Myxococcales bacterium]